MTTLIVLGSIAAYLVGWYFASLRVARRMNESEEKTYSGLSDSDRRFHLAMAMFVALGWPFVLPLLFVHGQMLGHVGATPKELRSENERLQREIDRLEREAGIS